MNNKNQTTTRRILLCITVLFSIVVLHPCLAKATFHYHINIVVPESSHNKTANIQHIKDIKHNIINRLEQSEKSLSSASQEKAIFNFIEQSKQEITQAIHPYGYFHPTIELTAQADKNVHNLEYRINLGPRVHLQSITLILKGPGQHDPILQHAIKDFPLHNLDPLDIEQYESGKEALLESTHLHGYLDAHYTKKQVNIDTKNNVAVILLTLQTGKQYHFGQMHFSDDRYDPLFLSRYATFHEGDRYDYQHLIDFQSALQLSGYFDSVYISTVKVPSDHHVDLNIQLQPTARQRFLYGIGYGDSGLRASFAWDWLNASRNGHTVSTQLQVSEQENSLSGQYTVPGHDPLTQQYVFGAATHHINNNAGESSAAKLSAAYQTMQYGWKNTYGLNMLYEDTRHMNDIPGDVVYMFYPNISFNKTVADDKINTRNGYRVRVNMQGTPKYLSNKSGFGQATLSGKYIDSISSNSRIILRGELGLLAADALNEIPLSLQFYAGGSMSIRGYSRQAFGPGNYLYTGSVEFQHWLNENWAIAAFIDGGNVINKGDPITLNKSIGLGIVRKTPLGPIEIGLASPLGRKDHSLRFVLRLGPDL